MPSPAEITARLAERVKELTEEVIAGTSYFLVDVNVRGHKGTRVVEVYIDSDEGLDHDNLAALSRELGFLLDVEDFIEGSYKLEVSSPGIKRPLTHRRQFRKNVGRTLRVKHQVSTGDSVDEHTTVGDLVQTDDDGITLEEASGDTVSIAFEAIEEARFELPW
jgi:ribosome maturation factor RimP